MKYEVIVRKVFTYRTRITVEVPYMGTSEEAKFQMEERAIEIALEECDRVPVDSWDHGACIERDAQVD